MAAAAELMAARPEVICCTSGTTGASKLFLVHPSQFPAMANVGCARYVSVTCRVEPWLGVALQELDASGIGACQLIGTLILWFMGICAPRHFWLAPRGGLTTANVS
jgi:hypothetical protein